MNRKILCIVLLGILLVTGFSAVSGKNLVANNNEAENENDITPIDVGTRIVARVEDSNGNYFRGITVTVWFEKPNGDKGWTSGNSFSDTVCPPIPFYLILQGYLGYPAGWKVYATSTINDENYRWPASGQYEIKESDPYDKYVTLEKETKRNKISEFGVFSQFPILELLLNLKNLN